MKRVNRRGMLGALGTLPLIGLGAGSVGGGGPNKSGGINAAALLKEADRKEYARLKAADLDDPAITAKRQSMPVGKIGNLLVGRLISGSNLISLNMHARDLGYVQSLAACYNTEERVFLTLKKCEEQGINFSLISKWSGTPNSPGRP